MTEPTLAHTLTKLRETFDPGGNLPEDCSEWASEHEAAMVALESALRPRYTAEQLAQQRQHCAEMQAFLRRKGAATNNLRDATTYAEIAAVIDAYLEALEQLQGGQ